VQLADTYKDQSNITYAKSLKKKLKKKKKKKKKKKRAFAISPF